jgi:ketosteroid isomerase-like protein
MNDEHKTLSWPSDCDPTSLAMDHVRLSYSYLDDGDVDGYCSLFDEQAVVRQPGCGDVTGRRELERVERTRQTGRSVRHQIYDVFGSGRRVAALGRLSHLPAATGNHATDVPFVDVFTVADNGLLIDRTTFLFATTARCGADRCCC